MSLPSLLPLAATSVAPVVGKVVERVAEGLSFLDVLHGQDDNAAATPPSRAVVNALDGDFAELSDRLRERLSSLGIDVTRPIRLKQDIRDRIVVDDDHPDRVLIESIFSNDEELANLFNAVAKAARDSRGQQQSGITKEFQLVFAGDNARIEFV